MQKFLSLVSALFLALSLCACTPAADISESSAPPEISEAPEISSAPEKSEESDAPEKSEPPEASAPEQSETEEPTISEPVKSCDETGEAYCEKYVAPWCLNCPFVFDFDYRDESAPEPPEKVSVSWLFANCWYIAHGESPDGKYEGTYPAQLVEDTIGRYFPFPPEELRRFANSEERDVIRYSGGEYRLARGFGGGGAYMAVSGYSKENGLLQLDCDMYSADQNTLLLSFSLVISESDGGYKYLANHVRYVSDDYETF